MTLQVTRREEFAIITLQRPDVLNALNYDTLVRLDQALDDVEGGDARALFLMGEGDRAFLRRCRYQRAGRTLH
jgi:enoyl-CoA hydratase